MSIQESEFRSQKASMFIRETLISLLFGILTPDS